MKKNRLRDLFSKRKIKEQLYSIYLLAIILPITLVGSVLLWNTYRMLTDYHRDLLASDNQRIKTVFFEITAQIFNISRDITFDDELQKILLEENGKGGNTYATLGTLISSHAEIDDINIYTDNPSAAKNAHFKYVDAETEEAEWYQKASTTSVVYWISMVTEDRYGNDNWHLTLVRRIPIIGSDYHAVLAINISDNYLQSRMGGDEYRVAVSDASGIICYSTERQEYGTPTTMNIDYEDDYFSYEGSMWEDADKLMTNISTLHPYQSASRIYITTISEKAYGDVTRILTTCLLIILLAIILPGVLIHFFTVYFNNRVNTLRVEMHKAENGDYDAPAILSGKDEISEAFADLQGVVRKIRASDDKLYAAKLKEQQLQNEQQLMEMKMLASQINPHFLYNTLESIRMQALTAGNKEVANSIKLLGKSMRYVLENTGTSEVTLKKEIDYMTTYMQIQKMRFREKFDYRLEIDELIDENSLMILPLLLQPITENALLHGLEEKESNGMIVIRIAPFGEDNLKISISDNGRGMTEEELEELRARMEQGTLDKTRSIGICNIHQRLRLYYGEEYGVSVHSKYGEGTEISVILPIRMADV